MVTIRKIKKLGLRGLVATLAIYGGLEASLAVSDYALSSNAEQETERIVGKKLYFLWDRDQNLSYFDVASASARRNWDNYGRQFALVKRVLVHSNPRFSSYQLYDDTIVLYPHDTHLVHEISHLWHKHLKDKSTFNSRWKAISENHYIESVDIKDANINGAVSWPALKNLEEDVAETAEFVYIVNKPQTIGTGLPIGPRNKIEAKITLLKDYEFISLLEAASAISQLK